MMLSEGPSSPAQRHYASLKCCGLFAQQSAISAQKTESYILRSFSIIACAEAILWLFESLSYDRNIMV